MKEEGRSKKPDGIRHNYQEEPASDAGERKKEKSGGAVGLRRLECQGGDIWFDSVYHLSCPRDSCSNTDYTDGTDGFILMSF